MSIARHHADWLSLVPVSGPFLSLPVLMEAFPQGLEIHDPDHNRLLRQEYATWQESFDKRKADPAPHHHWIKFVLTKTLDLDDHVLTEGQAIPQTLQVEVQEHHELLRPSIVVSDPITKKPRLLIQIYPRDQDLTSYVVKSPWKASPDTRMTELLHGTGVRLGLVTNGEHWMLVDAPKGETTGYASWYAALWLDEKITLQAFRSLLSASRFFNVPDEQTLEALLTKSASNQQEVTDQLGYQVRRAVEVLIHSLDRADQDFGRELLAGVKEEVLYESALTVMMRLVFLFCAEERELIPSKPFPVYEQNYSVSTISKQLRELADQHGEELLERRYDAWPRLLAAFRAVYNGLNHDDVHIPPYGGTLFAPDRFPFLEGRKPGASWKDTPANPLPVNNRTVLHLLEALQYLQMKVPGIKEKTLRRVSFKHLDIEQIGHVYEGLLDHTAKRATEPYLGLAGTRAKEPEIPLAELEKLLAKGEAELLKYLNEETGKSESALKKSLYAELEPQDVGQFRTACQGEDALWKRVQPLAGLVRSDEFGYPTVIPKGSVFVTAGTDRRSSGTHYTPRSLTEPIVQYTLEPLVYVGPAEGKPKTEWKLKSAKELLELKICDMACGSEAFLVQAARYMSERLLEAWDAAKLPNPISPGITPDGEPATGKLSEQLIPIEPQERTTFAMRLVAQRCLYGVDKNPLAVEMAKLSLWLLTLAKDKPFEFLDHAIRCGDSLVGIHDIEQLKNFSLKKDGAVKFHWTSEFQSPIDEAIALRLQLEELQATSLEDVKEQKKLHDQAQDKMLKLRCATDLLVAAEFWGDGPKDKMERLRHNASMAAHYLEDRDSTQAFEQLAAKERRGQSMFHWPLEFPEVIVKRGGFDAFVGNPPFMGGLRLADALGHQFRPFVIASVANGVGATADLCAYFFLRCFQLLRRNGHLGLLATNSVSQGLSREVGFDQMLANGGTIYRAISSSAWPGDASTEISHVWFRNGEWLALCLLDERTASSISSQLSEIAHDYFAPQPLIHNKDMALQGSNVLGLGFTLSPQDAARLIDANPSNADVLLPYINGKELNSHPTQAPVRWVIYFRDWPLDRDSAPDQYDGPVASDYPDCLAIVEREVRPERLRNNDKRRRELWWQFTRPTVELYEAISDRSYIPVRARIANLHSVVMITTRVVFSEKIVVFVDQPFSLLQSTVHELWAREFSSTMRTDMQYTPSLCYDNFPFAIETEECRLAGEKYHEHRRKIMLVRQEGLTKTYNRFHEADEASADIQKLRERHVELDQAVAAAYGWTDLDLGHGFHETKQGLRFTISEPARREVLQRLLKLNHERYAEEVQAGLHQKGKAERAKSAEAAKPSASSKQKKVKDKEEFLLPGFDSGPEESDKTVKPTTSTKAAPTQPKPSSTERVTPIEEVDVVDVMATFRQVARGRGWIGRDELLKEASLALGYQRLGHKMDEILRGHLRAALRRRIVEADGDQLRAATSTLADYTLDELRDSFISIMRKGTRYEREELMHSLVVHLGYERLTDTSREVIKSAFNSAIRQGVLGYEGNVVWREE